MGSLSSYTVLDIETTGLSPHTDDIRLVGIKRQDAAPEILTWPTTTDIPLAGNWLVGHNLRFDLSFLRTLAMEEMQWVDTEVLARLAWPDLPSYRLKWLAQHKLHMKTDEDAALDAWAVEENKQRLKKARQQQRDYIPCNKYADCPLELLTPYLKADLLMTEALLERVWPMVEDHPYLDTELRLTRAIFEMEKRGWYVKPDRLVGLVETTAADFDQLEAILTEKAPKLNLNSPAQVRAHLAALGIVVPATDKATLSRHTKEPWVALLLSYRETAKRLNTYYRPLYDYIGADNVLRTSFRQIGAITGRMSSSRPNMQNFGTKDPIRRCFAAPFTKHQLLFADYDGVEMRWLAHYSEDPILIQAIRQGKDLHEEAAKLIFTTDKPVPEQRRIAKTINFAKLYGAGSRRILETLGEAGTQLELPVVESILRRYDAAYPNIRAWTGKVQRQAVAKGGVVDIYGRFYPVDPLKPYTAANDLIQGTASQMMKRAFVRLHDAGLLILNVIHDEFIIAFDPDKTPLRSFRNHVQSLAEDLGTAKVPMTCKFSWSPDTWGNKTPL